MHTLNILLFSFNSQFSGEKNREFVHIDGG